ncbi:MAG: metallophosphoesterase [Rhodobacteraceae bacterium]|nr:metallophosphoesterase [Paracoccaceae bacterium]
MTKGTGHFEWLITPEFILIVIVILFKDPAHNMTSSALSRMGAWHDRRNDIGENQLFVLGDVHGQAHALEEALACIAAIPRTAERRKLVFLGDPIDRGPQNLRAMHLVLNAQVAAHVDEVVLLPGNHELMLLDALDNPLRYMGDWLDNGGVTVIAEAKPPASVRLLCDFAEIAQRIAPSAFLAAIREAPSHHRLANLLLVHAGLSPDQIPEAFLKLPKAGACGTHWAWIRRPFLDWRGGWGPEGRWLVVHGHTPAVRRLGDPSRFLALANRRHTHGRICLDAGAAYGLPQVGWAEFRADRFRLAISRAS